MGVFFSEPILQPTPKQSIYVHNYGRLSLYRENLCKVVVLRSYRKPGFEERTTYHAKKGAAHEQKLKNNLSRARSTVFELAMCNEWEYFVTLTFSPEKVADRYDLRGLMARLRKWLSNYNNRRCAGALRYLLIPERHEDGAWHLHGLLSQVNAGDLRAFSLGETLPVRLLWYLKDGNAVYCWTPYDKNFGYVTVEPVKDHACVSKYITKYMTKDQERSVTELNARSFYSSKGLNRRQILYEGTVCRDFDPDFENEHVKIKSGPLEQLLPLFAEDNTWERQSPGVAWKEEQTSDLGELDAVLAHALQERDH